MNQNYFFFFFACTFNLFYYVPNLLATPIVGSHPDIAYIFKFHVSIHRRSLETYQYEYFCGGSIIHKRYILTAAHCFMMKEHHTITQSMNIAQSRPKIIAGTNRRDGPGTEREIAKVFIPIIFNFLPETYADIAVAKLNADVGVTPNGDIEIASLSSLASYQVEYRTVTFCGFGRYEPEKGPDGILHPALISSEINRFLTVTIMSSEDCSNFRSAICARKLYDPVIRTACTGDSGAGLLYGNSILGVLSHGPPNCNSNTIPIVFTELWEFRDYVDSAMNEHDDHSNMYVIDEHSVLHLNPSHRGGPGHSPGSSLDSSPDNSPINSPPQSPSRGSRKWGFRKLLGKAKKAIGSSH